jgi:hypothetical protein
VSPIFVWKNGIRDAPVVNQKAAYLQIFNLKFFCTKNVNNTEGEERNFFKM